MAGPDTARQLRARLRQAGLSNGAITAAWPRWWSDAADTSLSARVDLSFSVARHLGLDPRSLFEDSGAPRFTWRQEARFKHLSTEDDVERAGITSFGRAVSAVLLEATPLPQEPLAATAKDLRGLLLEGAAPFVRMVDLLALCWSAGLPVAHLRVFPWPQKRLAAMTVRVDSRLAILLGKESLYPAPIAFYLAHELGHIMLAHLADDVALVDLEESQIGGGQRDADEVAADGFALELLTGEPEPVVLPAGPASSSRELARVALGSAMSLAIEPGTLAMCFGWSTGKWKTANAAMPRIYASAKPVWQEVNGIARQQLRLAHLTDDARDYLDAILGTTEGEVRTGQ